MYEDHKYLILYEERENEHKKIRRVYDKNDKAAVARSIFKQTLM